MGLAMRKPDQPTDSRVMVPGDLWQPDDRVLRQRALERDARRAKHEATHGVAREGLKMAEKAPGAVLPPDIRIARGEIELEPRVDVDPATGRVRRRGKGAVVTGPLGRYLRRKEITRRQWAAGTRFAADVEDAQPGVRSQLDPAKIDAPRGTGDAATGPTGLSVDAFAALMVRNARIALGRYLEAAVVAVAVHGQAASEWAVSTGRLKSDGLPVLKVALDTLADHYRLDASGLRINSD